MKLGRRYNRRALERAEREIGGRHDQDIQYPCMNFEELIKKKVGIFIGLNVSCFCFYFELLWVVDVHTDPLLLI